MQIRTNQAEAAIIRRTFDLYMKGHGFQAIAKLYNDEKIPRRYGKTFWHAHTIRYILTNEKYIGDSLTQKNYSTDTLPYRRLPNNGKYPKYYVKHNHEEIIDRDTFNAVQKLIAERKNEPAGKEKFPLSGKLRCAECGSTFRRQQLGDIAYWICMKKASGNSRCKSRRVKEDAVYDTFTKLLYKLKTYRTVLIEPLIETLQDMDYTASQKDIRSIDKSIADYSAKQTVLSKLYSSGALGTDEWNIKKSEVEFELNKLRKARKKLIGLQKQESVNAISTMNETLRENSLSSKFDEELFSELIDKIKEEENIVVKEIFDSYSKGNSLLKIAQLLNQRNIEYQPGTIGWNKARLKRILEDERYLGKRNFPQIVSEDLFQACNGIKQAKNKQENTDRKKEIYAAFLSNLGKVGFELVPFVLLVTIMIGFI